MRLAGSRLRSLAVASVVLLGVAVLCVAVVRLARGDDPAVPDDPSAANPLTERGFIEFRDRLEEMSGSTLVFRGFASADDGLVSVPVDATSGRSEMFTWRDGDFVEGSTEGTGTMDTSRFDLATIDAAGFEANVELALGLADDPDSVSIVFGRDETRPGACYTVFAQNESEDHASVRAACSGRMLENSVG